MLSFTHHILMHTLHASSFTFLSSCALHPLPHTHPPPHTQTCKKSEEILEAAEDGCKDLHQGWSTASLMFRIQNPIHPLLWMDVTTPGVRLCLCGDGGDGGDGGGWGGGKETHVV